jgi:ribonuclease BN (tRNA processing enzyme)
MPAQLCVLASGSRGNCTLIDADLDGKSGGCLIDCGLSPKSIGERLAAIGRSWNTITAVVLTHTHSDHWNRYAFSQLLHHHIPIYLHAVHHEVLIQSSPEYAKLRQANLVYSYEDGEAFQIGESLQCVPWNVPHDSNPTFGFRFDGRDAENQRWWSVGYAADLGEPPTELATLFHEVDVLCWEFNHDVAMQRNSGRSHSLIARVLGPNGHLSNEQAANWLRAHLATRETPLHAVVQLHLSRDCNTPVLAKAAAQDVLANKPLVRLVTATQDIPTRAIPLVGRARAPFDDIPTPRTKITHQPQLPGMT